MAESDNATSENQNTTKEEGREARKSDLRSALTHAVLLAALLVFVLWFLNQIAHIFFFILLAVITAVALNPPVTWLEKKGLPRVLGMLIVYLVLFAAIFGLGWLIVPLLGDQLTQLLQHLPDYARELSSRLSSWLHLLPGAASGAGAGTSIGSVISRALSFVGGVLQLSTSFFSTFLLFIIFVTLVAYLLVSPRPMLKAVLHVVPERHRAAFTRASVKSAGMIAAWILSNVIVGGIESVASAIFLLWMHVPGAIVWAALALFSEMIPNIGSYIMAIPPLLVALAVDPMTALWTLVFYVALNQVMSNTISPWIEGKQMKLQPAYLILMLLILTSAFGLLGAIVSRPLAGILQAFYDEFYLSRKKNDPHIEHYVERIVSA